MTLVGHTLGQFEIVEQIGAGGMATVYKAYQRSLDRYVAVKVLSGQLAHDDTFRQRFDREAKAVAALSHPYILPVYDFGEQDGWIYIVTELVEGGSLKERLGRPLEPGVAARIANEIAQALDYAHRHGIVHRDVKPGNILISKDGRTRLADFGIAKMVAGTQYTRTGTSIGTPAYMSPEQGRGEEIDGRSDLYSLGIVLYEMVTGSAPFRADTPLAILHQHVFSEVPPPRERNPRVPRKLQAVILKTLAKEPGDRYRTGRDMARALEKAVKLAPAEDLPAVAPEDAPTVALTPTTGEAAQRLAKATGRGAAVVGKGMARGLWGVGKLLLRVAIVLLIVVLILALVAAVGGSFALGSLAERTIPTYSSELAGFTAYGKDFFITEAEMDEGVGSSIEPYTLDIVRDVEFDFVPDDSVTISAELLGRPVRIHGRVELEDGVVRVYLERINKVPLYIVGGIMSNGINRGIQDLFDRASFRLDLLEVDETEIVIRAKDDRQSRLGPTPMPTLRPSPTARPTGEPLGKLTVVNEMYEGLELELAGETYQLVGRETLVLELPPDSYPYRFRVTKPGYQDGQGTVRVIQGNTMILNIRAEDGAGDAAQPAATSRPRPTATARNQSVAMSTASPKPADCPQPGVRITAPGMEATVRGQVVVQGTADVRNFDYYKLELGSGYRPDTWITLGDLHRAPVANGVLDTWDSSVHRRGVYVLRLVVVNKTGNFEECQVRLTVSQ